MPNILWAQLLDYRSPPRRRLRLFHALLFSLGLLLPSLFAAVEVLAENGSPLEASVRLPQHLGDETALPELQGRSVVPLPKASLPLFPFVPKVAVLATFAVVSKHSEHSLPHTQCSGRPLKLLLCTWLL